MAALHPPGPALLLVAAFSRHDAGLDWARQRLEAVHGPVALAGEPFSFTHTTYYQDTMGPDLRKQLLAFRDLVDEDCLAAVKRQTNALEEDLAGERRFPEVRPLNLDPGVLTLGKFVLATTKDQAHRIYLGQGIYAEVTLRFQAGAFEPWPWTYADYREPAVRSFLGEARNVYKRLLAQEARPG
jgi:hypothetical protein